jgi:hypothetical protein
MFILGLQRSMQDTSFVERLMFIRTVSMDYGLYNHNLLLLFTFLWVLETNWFYISTSYLCM